MERARAIFSACCGRKNRANSISQKPERFPEVGQGQSRSFVSRLAARHPATSKPLTGVININTDMGESF